MTASISNPSAARCTTTVPVAAATGPDMGEVFKS